MLRIRLIEEAIAARYSEQKMRCPTHLSIGQEAVAVGVCANLSSVDRAYSTHRAHAHYLAKGGNLEKLIAELYGKETGCTGGRGGSMHLTDLESGFVASTAIVGNAIPLAVGNALHQKVSGENAISVSFFGDGATEEGAFYESLNFAVVKQLPVLFVCENNRYSVYSPLSVRQPDARSISTLSQSMGIPAFDIDGNDLEAVTTASAEAINTIRSGRGPMLIECQTYRHREHCGPNFDDNLGYRPPDEVQKWTERDPIKRTVDSLMTNKQINEDELAEYRQQIMQEIDSAFERAAHSDYPNPAHNGRYLYA